ncbi:MAG: hypothetical protein AAGG01_19070, partial [Planctomycetota bacterium]
MSISLLLLGAAPATTLSASFPQDGAISLNPIPATPWTEVAPERAHVEPDGPIAPATYRPASDRLHFLESNGELWVRGATYKAHANDVGFTYYPFLGSDAPSLRPVTFRLRAATLEGRALDLSERAELRVDGERVTLDRGPVDVVYDHATDSVEQSFFVDAAGATGDLVLELDVTTDLAAGYEGRGFRFDSDLGGVHYGGAIVLDGVGHRADVPASLTAGRLTLTVPGSFLTEAEGQIIVDPILSTWTTDDRSESMLEPDIAYAGETDTFLYVYEEQFAVGDADIFFRETNINGVVSSSAYASLSSLNSIDPEIAYQDGDGVALIVYTVEDGAGNSAIRGRVRDVVNGGYVTPELIIGEVEANWPVNRNSDVGGNGTTNPNGLFMVAWVREFTSGVHSARFKTVAPDGTLGPLQGELAVEDLVHEVVVSKSVGLGSINQWNVAYISEDDGTGDFSILGRQFNADGTVLTGEATLRAFPSDEEPVDVDVSDTINVLGADPRYIVSYDEIGPGEEDIWIMVCDDNAELLRFDLALHEGEAVERNQLEARVATVRDHFVVSHLVQRDGSLILDAVISVFDLVGGLLPANMQQRELAGNTGGLWSGGCVMASRFSGGLTTSSWLGIGLAQFGVDSSGGMSWNIQGARYAAGAPRAVGVEYCYGEPNSSGQRGYMQIFGNSNVTDTKDLVATNLPQNSVGYFAQGTLPASIPNAGGSQGTLCIGGLVGRYAGSVINSGADGIIELTIDPTAIPTATGTV